MFVPFDARIASGHNNVAGLQLITSLSAGGVAFLEPWEHPADSWRRGVRRLTLAGTARREGFPAVRWRSGLLWLPQYQLLANTYEGRVTVRTRALGGAYANYNATLLLPDAADFELVNETQHGVALVDFVWEFVRLEAIP